MFDGHYDATSADVERSSSEQSRATLTTLSFQVADETLRLLLLQRDKTMDPKDIERLWNARSRIDEILVNQGECSE